MDVVLKALLTRTVRPGDGREEVEGYQGLGLPRTGEQIAPQNAKEIRDKFIEYFNSIYGSASWQSDYIHSTIDILINIFSFCVKYFSLLIDQFFISVLNKK